MIATIYSQTEMNGVILVALLAIGIALLVGMRMGVRMERKDPEPKKAKAKKYRVVRTARAFCGENGSAITQGGLPSQNEAEWFKAIT